MLLAMVQAWGVSFATATAIANAIQYGSWAWAIAALAFTGVGAFALYYALRRISTWALTEAVLW